MNLGIKNKRALITGASRGLGESIAINLAKEQVKVAVIARTEKDLKKLVAKMGGEKMGHFYYVCDLTKDGVPEKAVREITKKFGHPDILVNNLGGTLMVNDPFCSLADWRKVWRINVEVAIELNNLLIPNMIKNKWGRIVHVSSISALEGQGPITYSAAKAALTAYSRSMGRFIAPDGVIMTSVLPGAVFTEGGYWNMASKDKPEHVRKYLDERMAIKRFGRPDEIGAVVTFLCSELASFCVGSTVVVDGGQGKNLFS